MSASSYTERRVAELWEGMPAVIKKISCQEVGYLSVGCGLSQTSFASPWLHTLSQLLTEAPIQVSPQQEESNGATYHIQRASPA